MSPPAPDSGGFEIEDRDRWDPRRFHGVPGGSRAWKVTDEGILIQGEAAVRRTRGEPKTLTRIFEDFGEEITVTRTLLDSGISAQLLGAIIAVESGGRQPAERYEKHINDWSIGIVQTLTATAAALAMMAKDRLGLKAVAETIPIPKGGTLEEWRPLLSDPATSLRLGASYLVRNNARWQLQWDPILVYTTYNAGSPRPSDKTAWGIHAAGNVLDYFAAWYGDSCAVYGAC